MAKDTISKRLRAAIDYVWEVREQLDGGDVAAFFFHDRGNLKSRDSTFEKFGLDPSKPRDREFLLFILDDVIFGKGKPGAPKKWDYSEQEQLDTDIAVVRRKHPGKKSARAIAQTLVDDKDERFGARYKGMTADSLRKAISKLGNN